MPTVSREDFTRRLLQAQRRRRAREERAKEQDIYSYSVEAILRSVKIRMKMEGYY
ncbi:hypothetical protein Ami103574_04340 [Aminipila butyrica]|uniref:Uncharacterized protein n=1 Tax=Aminipila butyrica TaxID=433296 RepID=A0A858BWY2_9FIRM|nr:hypothetical protein [Aminipila butyrica]QIB68596.1 hypothetical protein Ami103574_04340 [Aminipila butyrica]